MSEALTPEEIAANKEAAAKAKAEEKARIAAEKKAAKELAAAEKKAITEAAKAAKAAATEAKKAEREAKAAEKAAAKAAKTEKMPSQNDVTRPKVSSACGKIWEIADQLSAKLGQPVPVKNLLEIAQAEGYNEATIKTQYARWRKFHGVTGRVVEPKVETPAETGGNEADAATAE